MTLEAITPATARAWQFLSDGVMGGLSQGRMALRHEAGLCFLRLSGEVRLENRGGFLQMRRAVAPGPGAEGVVLRVRGAGSGYFVHLRAGAGAPWAFFQAPLPVRADWADLAVPFAAFAPRGGAGALLVAQITSLGVVAYGQAGPARIDLAAWGMVGGAAP